jgi:hypothetical protein
LDSTPSERYWWECLLPLKRVRLSTYACSDLIDTDPYLWLPNHWLITSVTYAQSSSPRKWEAVLPKSTKSTKKPWSSDRRK